MCTLEHPLSIRVPLCAGAGRHSMGENPQTLTRREGQANWDERRNEKQPLLACLLSQDIVVMKLGASSSFGSCFVVMYSAAPLPPPFSGDRPTFHKLTLTPTSTHAREVGTQGA
jgi:hypothetical protein